MIPVEINNIKKEVNDNLSISELLIELKRDENGIAVAINDTVVAKNNWPETQLKPNDKILIIQATQGG